VAAALMTGIRAAKPDDATFAGTTVRAAGKKKLWVLPGGGDPAARIAFDDVPGNTTASDLRLTVQSSSAQSATTQPAILSGPLPETVSLPANSAMKVKIGSAPEKTLTLTAAFSGKLSALATALQELLRTEQENAFKQATVTVAGNRLLVLASPGTQSAVEFTKASAQDTTPEKLGLDAGSAVKRTATISRPLTGPLELPKPPRVIVTIGERQKSLVLGFDNASAGGQVALPDVAASLQAAIARSDVDPAFVNATVAVVDNQLVILAGEDKEVRFASIPPDTTATSLKLKGAKANVAAYQLGDGRNEQGKLEGQELIGSPAAKTGIYALEDVDLFNILCIPAAANLPAEQRGATISAAISYCERRRAFFLVDTPAEIADPTAIRSWLDAGGITRSRNAALYYPRVKVPDPLNGFRLRSVGASGSVAGVYARTDAARGVWKAPAGTEATLRNVTALDDLLTDGENGTLNPLAINCLRTFPVFGNVVWGARTLDGADQQASEWKYVPVRRLSLFLEESLYRGTKWVVFEPNGEPLWAQIRLNLGGFMHNLYRQGAFQGTTPRDAYFVKCDKETTTQNDIDLGIVNIVVGFAPLKPAEFVVITFQQMAGQIAT
jgi:hypothetical protein